MEKENFEFNIDVEVTTWYRNRFSVKATSLEEATALVTEAFNRGSFDEVTMLDKFNDDTETVILHDTTDATGRAQLYTLDGIHGDTFLAEYDD